MDVTSTVAAISTPFGAGGIGIIRISGPAAFAVAGKVFRANNQKAIDAMRGYSSALGRVYDGNHAIDDAILQIFRAPKSYTGEDVAELSCHGGTWILQHVLRLCIEHGAQPAAAGEFTKRAFLNGKLSLTQAEAVMDLIASQGESAAKAALSARDGSIAKEIGGIAESLTAQSAQLAAWADFPDEDLEKLDRAALTQAVTSAGDKITRLLQTYDTGKLLREGIAAAIVGKPNVGKSTLMNLLLQDERSIVTDIPGTTRDIIEDSLMLGGFRVNLADTAGIRSTSDVVEAAGVARSQKKIETAELIFAVFDSSDTLTAEDERLLESLKDKPCVAVINKIDLPQKLDLEKIKASIPRAVQISAKQKTGLRELETAATELLGVANLDPTAAIIQNERQRRCLKKAGESIAEAKLAFESNMLDAASACIDYALDELLVLTGERASDRVVGEVFARFCVGK